MPLNSPQKVLSYRMFPALMKADEAYMGLDTLGRGILFGILNHQCLNGSVPADPVAFSGIVRATPEEVRGFLATFTKLKTWRPLKAEGGPPLHRRTCEQGTGHVRRGYEESAAGPCGSPVDPSPGSLPRKP